jgi:FkbM family methyltransferase
VIPRLVSLLVLLPLVGPAAHAGAPDDLLTAGKKRYSQHDEELLIRHFFDDRRDAVFLDVGAYHWKDASTTLYLERHLGWSGVAVDALASFEQGYLENRPKTRFFTYIVSDRSGETATIYVKGAITSTDPKHHEQFQALKRAPVPVEVPTITLDDLLDNEKIEKIDFLSMDIEGGEPTALAGFDIRRFRPELVCIEASLSVREQIEAYFAAHDYERIDAYLEYDSVNWYYRPKPEPPAVPSAEDAGRSTR